MSNLRKQGVCLKAKCADVFAAIAPSDYHCFSFASFGRNSHQKNKKTKTNKQKKPKNSMIRTCKISHHGCRAEVRGGKIQAACLCLLAQSSQDPVMFGLTPLEFKWSLQFLKIFSLNLIPWVRHADVSHVFRPRTLLNGLILLSRVGIGPEMDA